MKNYLLSFVEVLRQLVFFVIMVRIVLSWFGNPYNRLTGFIYSVADPILKPFKKIVPLIGMLDFSPVVAVLVIDFAFQLVSRLINTL